VPGRGFAIIACVPRAAPPSAPRGEQSLCRIHHQRLRLGVVHLPQGHKLRPFRRAQAFELLLMMEDMAARKLNPHTQRSQISSWASGSLLG
jgi:hypothetical protein